MFYGKEVKKIDEKGRISFSKKVRLGVRDNPLILKRNGKIRIYPEKEIEKFKPSQVFPTKFDKQGRILIPAKLGFWFRSVFLVGCGDYLEIRPREPVKIIEVIRSALKNIETEVKTMIGKEVSYSEITVEELLVLHLYGIAAPADGDKQVVVLTSE